ncbi:hypothetical protein M514_06883 [Trichuris suis]|uniref:Peptidase M20 dimerisation domain-containing protein n=1 Tax=Trichuris suis TaxID=68888 RepID=A0A085MR76_9BILA|nr:hypothetical protein M514_06883 [Trichuris suis]
MQYLEAASRLKHINVPLKRSIHICFVPDEEVGSTEGMGKFVETEEFRLLNVGLCLDEREELHLKTRSCKRRRYFQLSNRQNVRCFSDFDIRVPLSASFNVTLLKL